MNKNVFMKEETLPEKLIVIIADYLNNDLTDESARELIMWLEEDENNRSFLSEIESIWHLASETGGKCPDTGRALNLILDRIKETGIRSFAKRQIKVSTILKIAASFLLFAAIGSAIFFISDLNSSGEETRFFESNAPRGSRSVITLPDQSTIWLNAETKLKYSSDFGKNSRDINLEGEAFFSVAKNPKIPFKVITKELCIEATGTSFNVKAYSNEDFIETTLETGEVRIDPLSDSLLEFPDITLRPNQKVVYSNFKDKNSKPVITIDTLVDTRLTTSWKDSKWFFRSEKLNKMVPILERRYNVTISFRDPMLGNYRFTGTIKEETIRQVIDALCTAAPIEYEINGNTIILREDTDRKNKFNIQQR